MANFQMNHLTDPCFGRLVQLTNGKVEVRVTLDYGPRVIHCSCVDMENMFYQDTDKKPLGEKLDVYDDQFILYGGHRIWFSPEILPRCYHPDNKPVALTPLDDGAVFTAAVEAHNRIQKVLTVQLIEDTSTIRVTNGIRNVGLWDVELSVWALTMVDKGGQTVMPMPNRRTELLSNRNISLWDYAEMNDSRVYWGKSFITITQNAEKENPFKMGYNNEAGWAAYFNKGQVFIKFFEPSLEGLYPDNGCCYESYVNAKMLEMETLSEYVCLSPDDYVAHVEEWELHPVAFTPTHDEAKLAEAMAPYLPVL